MCWLCAEGCGSREADSQLHSCAVGEMRQNESYCSCVRARLWVRLDYSHFTDEKAKTLLSTPAQTPPQPGYIGGTQAGTWAPAFCNVPGDLAECGLHWGLGMPFAVQKASDRGCNSSHT